MARAKTVAAFFALAIVLSAVSVAVLMRAPTDGFAALRELDVKETIRVDESHTVHQFEFAQPCQQLRPQLDSWRDQWLASNKAGSLTDLEDRTDGPTEWAPADRWTLLLPKLSPGYNCAFKVLLPNSAPTQP